MRAQDWTYLGQLVRVLQEEGVAGHKIGEMVAEVEQHLVESGADPVDEFGTPYSLGSELAARPGSNRPGWVPPMWATILAGAVFLLVVAPLFPLLPLWPGEDAADSVLPLTVGAVSYAVVFFLGVSWVRRSINQQLDGRSWQALSGWRIGLKILVLSIVVTSAQMAGQDQTIVAWPRIPYLAFSTIVVPVLVFVMIRSRNPVRFPEHARHLDPLKRGPLAGRPPISVE